MIGWIAWILQGGGVSFHFRSPQVGPKSCGHRFFLQKKINDRRNRNGSKNEESEIPKNRYQGTLHSLLTGNTKRTPSYLSYLQTTDSFKRPETTPKPAHAAGTRRDAKVKELLSFQGGPPMQQWMADHS